MMLLPYAGYDASERQITPRGPASRFTGEQIGEMLAMAEDGASSIEICHQLHVKPEAIRAKLWRLGVRLRRRITRSRLRLVVPVTKAMSIAAERRGISVQAMIKRLLAVTSKNDLFDQLLPVPKPHSLGAAAVHETPTPAGSGAGAAPVAGIPSPSAAAAFCIVLNQPRLIGCARLG